MVDISHPLGGGAAFVSGNKLLRWRNKRPERSESELEAVAAERGDYTPSQIVALFVLVAIVSCLPIALHPWPPLSDYINHLSRMHVIATIGTDPDLARFYEIKWEVVPNLMMDLIVPLIQRVTDVYVAGQIYTIASFVLILSGALALNRQLFGRWSMLPLIVAPLMYNQVFLVGTMNYVSAVGVALWSLAAWIALRERSLALRLPVSAACVMILFFCHLYAVGVYGVGLLAYELYRLVELHGATPLSRRGRGEIGWRIADFVASGLPFLPVPLLVMMSPTWGLRAGYSWELAGKLEGILFVFELYFTRTALLVTAALIIMAALAGYYRLLRVHAFGWILLLVAAVVYMVMPRVIFDTYMADQRLPISVVFMVIACGQLDMRSAFVRRAFATILFAVLALRVGEVQAEWNAAARTSDSFRQSVNMIARGSRILVAYAFADAGDGPDDHGLVHAPCLAIIERSSLVTTAFTVMGKQIMHARADYRDIVDTEDGTPPSVNQLLAMAANPETETDAFWGDWTLDYDYVYVLFTRAGEGNPDPTHLETKFVGDRFALYRVVRPEQTPAEPPANQEPPGVMAETKVVRIGPEVRHPRSHPRRLN